MLTNLMKQKLYPHNILAIENHSFAFTTFTIAQLQDGWAILDGSPRWHKGRHIKVPSGHCIHSISHPSITRISGLCQHSPHPYSTRPLQTLHPTPSAWGCCLLALYHGTNWGTYFHHQKSPVCIVATVLIAPTHFFTPLLVHSISTTASVQPLMPSSFRTHWCTLTDSLSLWENWSVSSQSVLARLPLAALLGWYSNILCLLCFLVFWFPSLLCQWSLDVW